MQTEYVKETIVISTRLELHPVHTVVTDLLSRELFKVEAKTTYLLERISKQDKSHSSDPLC